LLRIGLIAGIIEIYISLTGMVEAFNRRDIIAGVLSLGDTWC
jgi:hypothetical protein